MQKRTYLSARFCWGTWYLQGILFSLHANECTYENTSQCKIQIYRYICRSICGGWPWELRKGSVERIANRLPITGPSLASRPAALWSRFVSHAAYGVGLTSWQAIYNSLWLILHNHECKRENRFLDWGNHIWISVSRPTELCKNNWLLPVFVFIFVFMFVVMFVAAVVVVVVVVVVAGGDGGGGGGGGGGGVVGVVGLWHFMSSLFFLRIFFPRVIPSL